MPPSQRGTGFTNFQQWLSLNQGSAQRMGDDLAARVEGKGQAFTNNLSAAQDAFGRAVDDGALSGPGVPGSASYDEALRNAEGGYKGPQGFGDTPGVDVGALTTQAADAQRDARASGTQGGRATMLADKYGQTSWGGGQLDAALAGAGGAGGRLAKSQGAYGKLLERFGGAQAEAANTVKRAQETSATNAAAWGKEAGRLEQQSRTTYGPQQDIPPERETRPETRERNPRGRGGYYP